MKKLLFVSSLNESSYTGGNLCSKRNYEAVVDILSEEQVLFFGLAPENNTFFVRVVRRLASALSGYMLGLNRRNEKQILSIIERENISTIFLDSSLLGKLAKSVRKKFPNVKIITFFHNNEYHFAKQQVFINRSFIRSFWIPLAYYNDKCACLYSDKVIMLNASDATEIELLYKRKYDCLIPISMKDRYKERGEVASVGSSSDVKKVLFIGSWFFANAQGIKWFIKNVLPKTTIELTVVGNGMNNLKNEIVIPDNVLVFDNVPDMRPFYEEADAIILPLVSGSGMKVKTAEALMYGKYLIATKEALNGYTIEESIGVCCETEQDFVTAIENLSNVKKFNVSSRELFCKSHSYETTLSLFNELLKVI